MFCCSSTTWGILALVGNEAELTKISLFIFIFKGPVLMRNPAVITNALIPGELTDYTNVF